MRREISKWFSPNLNKDMEIVAYGDYGFALLLFPTAAADYLEYERFQMIETLAPYIDAGKVKVYSINSINNESWLNDDMNPRDKIVRHKQFNDYVTEEVVPFINNDCNNEAEIITSGASLGALHCANLYFRRPDLFAGTIAMSGSYDLSDYSKGYFDEDCYFNSPMHYLPNLEDQTILDQMRKSKHIHLLTGQGNYEKPQATEELSAILNSKNVPNNAELWGLDVPHDWPTWRKMIPYIIETKF
ncbi:MAG: alpha/beta hydrolase-fold protein [Ignavibacteria bacterium]|nr:esterase family protein [Ignavibacteriota bacterium]